MGDYATDGPPAPYPAPGDPAARYAGQLPDLDFTLRNQLAQTEASIRQLAYDTGNGALDFSTLDLDAIVQNFRNDAADYCQMMQGNAITFGGAVDPNCQGNTGLIDKYANLLQQFLYAIRAGQASIRQPVKPCSATTAGPYQRYCAGGPGATPLPPSTAQVMAQLTGGAVMPVLPPPPSGGGSSSGPGVQPISVAVAPPAATAVPGAAGSAVADFFSSTFSVGGYSIPYWVAAAGAVAVGFIAFSGKK